MECSEIMFLSCRVCISTSDEPHSLTPVKSPATVEALGWALMMLMTHHNQDLDRGSYMNIHIQTNLLNEFKNREKM